MAQTPLLAAALFLSAAPSVCLAQRARTADTYNQQLFAPSYTIDNSGPASTTSSNTNVTRYQGSYTLHNTPDIQAPSIVGGNPCSVGVSGGVSVAGFGLAAGATYADKGCERRNVAAILFNMGEHDAAMAVMCNNDEVRDAMRALAKPCIQDRPPSAPVSAPAAAPAPAPGSTPAPAATAQPVAVVSPFGVRPAWCDRARPGNAAETAYLDTHCGARPGGGGGGMGRPG